MKIIKKFRKLFSLMIVLFQSMLKKNAINFRTTTTPDNFSYSGTVMFSNYFTNAQASQIELFNHMDLELIEEAIDDNLLNMELIAQRYFVKSTMAATVYRTPFGIVFFSHLNKEGRLAKDGEPIGEKLEKLSLVDHVIITYDVDKQQEMLRFVETLESLFTVELHEEPRPPRPASYQKLLFNKQQQIYYTKTMYLKNKDSKDIDDLYESVPLEVAGKTQVVPMSVIYDITKNHLLSSEKGIFTASGVPGTGKTQFIQRLMADVGGKTRILRIDASNVPLLNDPSFEEFLLGWVEKNVGPKVMWIEEGDDLVKTESMDKGRSPIVSMILNLIDGPGFSEYGLRIVLTHNLKKEYIDPALLRYGRNIFNQAIEYDLLGVEKVQSLILNYPDEFIVQKANDYFAIEENRVPMSIATVYGLFGVNNVEDRLEIQLNKILEGREETEAKEREAVEKEIEALDRELNGVLEGPSELETVTIVKEEPNEEVRD